MLFNPRTGAAERQAKALFAGAFLVWLSIVCAIGYVVVHFVAKFW